MLVPRRGERYAPTCRPPDPDTRKPKYQLPEGACDAHCHIFGPGDRYPYAPNRTYTPPDAPLENFTALQAILGLKRAVLVNASCHGTDNRVIVDAIAQSNGRYRGVANVDDSFTERDFETLHRDGFRGSQHRRRFQVRRQSCTGRFSVNRSSSSAD